MKKKRVNTLKLARSLKGEGVQKKDLRSYLEIAGQSRYLGRMAGEDPSRFRQVVDDYRICDFDDNAIINEFTFKNRHRGIFGFEPLTIGLAGGLSMYLLGEFSEIVQVHLGQGIPYSHLLKEYGLYIAGSAVITKMLFGLDDLFKESSTTSINKQARIQRTSQVEKYLADQENVPRPSFIRTKDDLRKYSKDTL